jgi:hypothetical protein
MSWRRRLLSWRPTNATGESPAGVRPPSTAMPTGDPDPLALRCRTCGALLGADDEDEPAGDAGGPICGECNRARNFDALFER